MIDYSRGKIYKIESINGEDGDIYIGSTTEKLLSERMSKHRSDYKRWKNENVKCKYTSFILFDKYGVENCNIILLELVNCNSKDELLARERHFIKTLKCVNIQIPLRTIKEYHQDNFEKEKQYRIDNREQLNENRKIYYEKN